LLLLGSGLPRIFAQQPASTYQPPPPPAAGAPAERQAPPGAAPKSEGHVTIEIGRGQRPLIRLAVPAFHTGALPGAAGAAARELEETLYNDLDVSGYFQLQGPEQLKTIAVSGDPQRDVATFRAQGNEILLLGDLRAEADRLVFEGRLFDLGSGQAIVAKRYRGELSVVRRMAHTFADEVVRYLTSFPGIALSTLAFTSDRTGHKEIFLMDYDGKNQRRLTGHHSTSM
ncbi:MAG: hypothetical protein M3O15_02255, partial [Acidobacteriota bacterium]|nr:hypothetical protein [Acidobacteriota bacterium]